ncbi:hypothetical protein [Microbacterium aureliae]
MHVFISWSKPRSLRVAIALREYLPTVIQECREIFVSSEQEKGVAWFSNIAHNLDSAAVGLVLITPENQTEAWLNFEGGALLGRFDDRRVCPVLLWMEQSDYAGPLANLHMTRAEDKDDVLRLLKKINSLSENPIDNTILEKAHDRAWPELEAAIQTAHDEPGGVEPQRSDSQKIDEMLGILREIRRYPGDEADAQPNTASAHLRSRLTNERFMTSTLRPSEVDAAVALWNEALAHRLRAQRDDGSRLLPDAAREPSEDGDVEH